VIKALVTKVFCNMRLNIASFPFFCNLFFINRFYHFMDKKNPEPPIFLWMFIINLHHDLCCNLKGPYFSLG
jgi:hypothetical protein